MTHGPEVEGAWATLENMIGVRYRRPRSRPQREVGNTLHTMLMTDTHIPFHCADEIAEAWRSTDCSRLILGGDVGDSTSLSTFVKYENVDILDELNQVGDFIDTAARMFDDVIVMGGNHDPDRFTKRLIERNSSDMVKAIRFLTGGPMDPLQAICTRHSNVEYVQHMTSTGPRSWLYVQGDVIVSHREDYSAVPAAALRRIGPHFQSHYVSLGVPKDYRVLFQAHTHTVCLIPDGPNRLLYETGCCCKDHEYQTRADSKGSTQIRAYMTFKQSDGVTDFSSIRHHYL